MKTVKIKINGMTCGHCSAAVKNEVSSINGVVSVNVDLDSAKATVEFDEQKIDIERIKRGITNAGYSPE